MANEILRLAVEKPSSERLAALEAHWQQRSLPKAQAFVNSIIHRVGKPVKASYVYLVPPRATYLPADATRGDSREPSRNLMVVDAIEVWTYQGSILVYVEQFEFTYTLALRQDGRWVIIDHLYRNAPTPEPLPRAASMDQGGDSLHLPSRGS